MKTIVTILCLLPLLAAAQQQQEEPIILATADAVAIPAAKHKIPLDSAYIYAVDAYTKGDYYTSHAYAADAIFNDAAKMNRKLAADMYAMAIKSSYASGHYSSAIVYYENLRKTKYRYNDDLTRMAIFSYFPVKALQHQDEYNLDLKDTAFVLKIVNEMVRKDPRWLMVRAKIYNSIYGNDTLPEEVQEAYKAKMEEDMADYTAGCAADEWKNLLTM